MDYYTKAEIDAKLLEFVHLLGTETIAGNKTFTGNLKMPQLSNPNASGLNFLRTGGDGNLYFRNQTDTQRDLGILTQYFSELTEANYVNKQVASQYFNTDKNVWRTWNGKAWRDNTTTVYPDDYNFQTDYEKIQYAINKATQGSIVQLGNKTYTLDRPILIGNSITLRGGDNTIITRPNADIKHLTVAADGTSTTLTLDDVTGIVEGDFIIIYTGVAWNQSSEPIVVRGVTGNTLTISTFYWTNGSPLSFAIGAKVLKSIGFILVADFSNTESVGSRAVTIENITFDGNRAGNTECYRYNFHMAVLSECSKRTTIRGCKFINAPTESVLGHNIDLLYNIFKNNNGSIYHASISKEWIEEDIFMTNIIGNISDYSNQVSTTISGHSEGVLTTSNSGGYVNATMNRLLNIGSDAAVLGALYPSSTYQDWGTSNYNFSGNIVNGATRLIFLINITTPGYLGNVYINNNLLLNVGWYDYSVALAVHPNMVINQTSGGQDLTQPIKTSQYKLSALNKAPISATDTGELGEIKIDDNFIYVCIATNKWVRTPLIDF